MISGRVRFAAIAFFLFILFVPITVTATGGYDVTTGPHDRVPGTSHDPVAMSFWDLSPRVMALAVVLSFAPVFVSPVELFFSLKLTVALGYRKVEQYAVRYNEKRQKIFDCITANPGVKFHALERQTGIKEGPLKYHLLILGAKRRIVSFGTGRSVRYFENNGRYSELEKRVFLHLQDPTTRRILEILATSPEVSRKDIAGIMGIAGPSISWHTKRLSGDGIITTTKNGRAVRYTLCPAGVNIFKRYREQDAAACGNAETVKETGK
ncbi:MAG: winged helix-turn-helix transcriptional regulator [Methanoregula sp.]